MKKILNEITIIEYFTNFLKHGRRRDSAYFWGLAIIHLSKIK